MKPFLLSLLLAIPLLADVKINRRQDQIDVVIGGKPFTTFYFGATTNKPYLHPLRAADGTIMTRGYPMEQIEGETKDHPHHQGLWFTHGDVNGLDFWANAKLTPKQGRVVLDKITRAQGGSKTGIIEGTFNWVDPNGKTLLREQRKMTFYDDATNRIVDFDITLTAADTPVKFGDTKEGVFAIRLNDKMTERAKGGQMMMANGDKGEKLVWGKPSPWVDYAGSIDGKPLGIAIFDHPQNPKHPTHWHSRAYGLFAANIFGEHDFYNNKARDGSVTLEPSKSMRFRYRVLIHPGQMAPNQINEFYDRYKQANAK